MANTRVMTALRQIRLFRWEPGTDLLVVAASWLLVVGSIYTATQVVGHTVWGGMGYFLLYALFGATICGVGLPLWWMTRVRRRPLSDLGLTTRWLLPSIALQVAFAVPQFLATLARTPLPSLQSLLPLIGLALAIGFFEALFWRGWVLLRLEEAFGLLPALLLGSALYAAYHIGYGMAAGEMLFLFFIGLLYALIFRVTRNVLILWPIFQPMGQLVTLVKNGLSLPVLAALGFIEVLAVMLVLVWLAGRLQARASRMSGKSGATAVPADSNV